ncbi:RHOMBOID-like protein 12, mitochondrial isoform X2 [Ananas comosus]|uniref:RHOMBOID-like protein 12, mitochondrial isoform X2 n=1 Tax=Ananas comosus TaxID=4615 RepID=A0A6P5F0J3_ANACO|nr:RHOMBOID-like protein 12, mitochondrial isoform X2 [Ananas comosus]
MRKLLHSNLSRRLNQTLAAAAAPKSTAETLALFASSAAPPRHHHLLLRRFHSWRPPSHHRGRLRPPTGTLGFLSGTILFNRAGAAAAAARSAVRRSSAWQEIRSLLVSLQRRSGAGHLFSSIRRSTYWIQSPDGVVQFLIGTNIAVFFLWRIADPLFMRKHFMISLDNFRSGRLHTLLTSAFSHSDLDHLVTNMIGLYFFGLNIANRFGPQFLLKLYLAGALTGSVFFLVHKAFLVPPKASYRGWDDSRVPALGASAAVNAIILLEVFLFPTRLVYLYFVVPVPAMLVGALLIGSDLWRIKTGQGHVSGSAHLGGAFVAALAWARIKKGWF